MGKENTQHITGSVYHFRTVEYERVSIYFI